MYAKLELGNFIKVERELRRDRVLELSLAGKSTRAIAAELGVEHSTILRDLKARLALMRKGSKEDERHRTLQQARTQKPVTVLRPPPNCSCQWSVVRRGASSAGSSLSS